MENQGDSQKHTDGGLQKSRGSLFQQYGILFYLLVRRYEIPNIEITVEPSEGEDAKFAFSAEGTKESSKIIELVQYKKHESSDDKNGVGVSGDDWREGPIKVSTLKKWVTRKRPDISVLDLLESDDRIFFTAIVFGKIEPGLKGFIPENLHTQLLNFRGFWSGFLTAFPFRHKHSQDPMENQTNKKLVFGTESIRKRVRILRLGSPIILEVQCRYILEKFYQVRRQLSGQVVDKLLIEIVKRETIKDENSRRFLPQDIEAIIAEGRVGKIKWQTPQEFLQPQNSTLADPNLGEPPQWIDFAHGRYAELAEYKEAWDALEGSGIIAICGAPGTGKTVLTHYLAYRFLQYAANRNVYYLPIRLDETLSDELEFMVDRIETNTLFIIDDQHLAFDEVELLVRTFSDYYSIGKAQARLVVTSTHTFGKTSKGRRGRESELSRAMLVRLIYGKTDEMLEVISEVRLKAGLSTPLSDRELLQLSEGNLELAIILGRCAKDIEGRVPLDSLFENSTLKRHLVDWILRNLGRDEDITFFEREIAPIFIVGASQLIIPEDYSKAVIELLDAGFLEAGRSDDAKSNLFFTSNYWLSKFIRAQYQSREFQVLSEYIKRYPKLLSMFCERLSESGLSSHCLRRLFQEERDFLIQTINDPFSPITLDDICKILFSITAIDHGGEDARFLRELMSSEGRPNYRFFSRFLRPERVQNLLSLSTFFYTLHQIDRYIAREVAATTIQQEHIDFILSLLADGRLDEIGACLHAISKCSREAALVLYERLKVPAQ